MNAFAAPGWIGMGLLLSLIAGCGTSGGSPTAAGPAVGSVKATPGAPAAQKLAGTVVVDGSSTVFRISKAAQLRFAKERSRAVKVLVANHGTGGGFSKYLEGEVDIIDASRPAKPEEEKKATEKGLFWTRFIVGYDGITVVVNQSNDFVQSLGVDQLKKLFAPEAEAKTWKDLDATWPDRKVVLYTPDNDSGTFEFFTDAIVGKKAQRKDVQASPDDNVLVKGVSGDADGLGYFGYAYYAANRDSLRAVPIRSGPGAAPVGPNLDTILTKKYTPLSRPLYIYVKKSELRRSEVAAFVSFYLENIESLATQAGYVPPTEEDRAANGKALGGAAAASG
jgi:phosphate transport system substrate-binding protein